MEAIVRLMVDLVRDVVKAKGGLDVRRFINMVWLEGRSQLLLCYMYSTRMCSM